MHMSPWIVNVVALACVSGAQADVVIDAVPVGNPGNAGELSCEGAGGGCEARICGAVDYVYNIGKHEVDRDGFRVAEASGQATPGDCDCTDLSDDNDTDLADFAAFQPLLSGL